MSPIRHMDTDACYSVNNQIISTKDAINDSVTQIYSQVDGMVGSAWIAPGADQFKSDIEQWRSQLQQALEQLQTLSDRFKTEIEHWIDEGQSY